MLVACSGGYSFTGASIPPQAKTIAIKQFPNYAASVNPLLSQKLYEKMRSTFESQTSLSVTSSDGDLAVSGEITGYVTQTSALSANDNVATNRLTITIKVKFTNVYDPDADFEQSFSRYKEYDASRDFSSVESGLVEELVEELADDIFQKTVVNW
ncbi:MAG: LptE family protein [Bacteroidales bacterium]|nr:LptE family protein [Candidatus Colimorpha onthohippi]